MEKVLLHQHWNAVTQNGREHTEFSVRFIRNIKSFIFQIVEELCLAINWNNSNWEMRTIQNRPQRFIFYPHELINESPYSHVAAVRTLHIVYLSLALLTHE